MKKKESEILELKESTSEIKESLKSISAILNKHQSGKIIFGLKDNGEVIGQQIGKNTIRDVSQAISHNIEPKIFPEINTIKIENKDCIEVKFIGEKIPYSACQKYYIRVSDEDKQMSREELFKLIRRTDKEEMKWDDKFCKEAKIEDIDEKRLAWFLTLAERELTTVLGALNKLGLVKDGKLLNAAVILFGKSPQNFFRNAKLRGAVFDEASDIIDMQEFEGNLFDLIEEAEKYFLKNIHIGMRLEGMRRINIPEINKDAFREAIINAFCHRNYWNQDNVHLAIYKDKVEVRSPGLLIDELTIERITTEEISERRNELIAEMFHRINFVERWGKGIKKILKLEPETEFKELGRKFYSIFKRKNEPGKNQAKTRQKPSKKERIELILKFIKEGRFSQRGFAETFELNKSTIEEDLKKLKEEGKVELIGKGKGGEWKITKQIKTKKPKQ